MTEQNPIRIAIADDHTLFRTGLAELIHLFGPFKVTVLEKNGLALLDTLAKSASLPEICILDINMPQMNGYDTVLRLKELYPDMKVLAVSMHETEFSILKMIRNGADGYLMKDAEPEELERALISLHEKGVYHSEFLSGRIISQIQNHSTDILSLINISETELRYLQLLCSDLSIKE
ncbi:MAG: response regulator transcription factor, partial [Chitinophagaceae bacterium]